MGMALLDMTSQKELADRAGLNQKTIVTLMQGQVSPDSSTMTLVAQALGQKRSWLEGEDDIRNFQIPGDLAVTIDDTLSKSHGVKITALERRAAPPASVREPDVTYPEKKIAPVNRRGDLPVFPIAKKGQKGAVAIPTWHNAAAGYGEDLERGEELTYVRELPDWKGVHSVFVRGDSMEQTLHNGDLILVQQFQNPNGFIDLPPRGTDPKNSRAQLEQFVPNDKLFILAIGHGAGEDFTIDVGPTIKRVRYEGGFDWELFIDADNPVVWKSKKVRSKQSVRFYARVMGIGNGKYA
jgi:transcriptional regulator with XRE-family HTH domain